MKNRGKSTKTAENNPEKVFASEKKSGNKNRGNIILGEKNAENFRGFRFFSAENATLGLTPTQCP